MRYYGLDTTNQLKAASPTLRLATSFDYVRCHHAKSLMHYFMAYSNESYMKSYSRAAYASGPSALQSCRVVVDAHSPPFTNASLIVSNLADFENVFSTSA